MKPVTKAAALDRRTGWIRGVKKVGSQVLDDLLGGMRWEKKQ